jgi:hypothetical protein
VFAPLQSASRRATHDSASSFRAPPSKKRLTDAFVPERKIKREPTVRESAMAIVKAGWLNVLLVVIPVRPLLLDPLILLTGFPLLQW